MTTAASNAPMMINCGPHGDRISAVICQHLLLSAPAPAGFVENGSDPQDLQAWCHRCEEKFLEQDGMTDAFREFNDMKIVCVVCYDEARALHAIVADR